MCANPKADPNILEPNPKAQAQLPGLAFAPVLALAPTFALALSCPPTSASPLISHPSPHPRTRPHQVSAEYESLKRAVTTGNWGTTPARQAYLQGLRTPRSEPARQQLGSFAQFAREHMEWFELVRNTVPHGAPRLHLRTEDLTDGAEVLHNTMQRVFRFLGLPPLRAQLQLPARLLAPERTPHQPLF